MRDQRFLLRRIPSDLGMLGITTLPQTTQPTSLFAAATSPPIPASGSTWDISTLSISRSRTDLTGSKSIITTRFSAPGGIDTMSRNYLDITSGEFSVYNSINFRNLSVRGSGSGEVGTIRVNSHAQRREGLRTLLSRHCGKFGIDSVHGTIDPKGYDFDIAEPSFYKQHRNSLVTPMITNTGTIRKAVKGPAI